MLSVLAGALFLTSLLGGRLALAYRKSGQYHKEDALWWADTWKEENQAHNTTKSENQLLRDIIQVEVEDLSKQCDTCRTKKSLTDYHSHPTCKYCRKEEDAARYKAKKEVQV